jgi:hypothetical protein
MDRDVLWELWWVLQKGSVFLINVARQVSPKAGGAGAESASAATDESKIYPPRQKSKFLSVAKIARVK